MNRIERQIAAITAIADCKDERLVVVDSYGNDLEIGIYQLANDVKDTLEKLNAVYEAAKGLAYSRINGVTFPKLIELVEAAGEAMMLKTGADFDGHTYSNDSQAS